MLRRVEQALGEQGLCGGETVAVALSGGADSVALLGCLLQLRERWRLTLLACHVNHQLRGEESQRDEAFVEELCRRLEVPLRLCRVDVRGEMRRSGGSLELAARRLRYQALEELAPPEARIATAHTLNDQAETMLFHLARGTGLRGMAGIPPVRGRVIRPLLWVTRRQVEDYCRERRLDYVTDSSNLSDRFTRNRIRHQVIPVLEEVNGAALHNFGNFSRQARRDEEFLQSLAREQLEKLRQGDGICREGFLKLPEALRDRAAALLLEELGAPVTARRVEQLVGLARRGGGAEEFVRNGRVTADVEQLRLVCVQPPQPYFEQPIFWGEREVYPGRNVNILLCEYEEYKKIEKKQRDVLKKAVDYDKIEDNAVLRQRREGDRIRFWDSGVTRPLKKWMNEAKIPVEQRGRLLVLSDRQGPLWVEGFGSSHRTAVTGQTRRVLMILPTEGAPCQPCGGQFGEGQAR